MRNFTKKIKKCFIGAHNHMKNHHTKYMVCGFGTYSVAKMIALFLPFIIGYYAGLHLPFANAKAWMNNDNFLTIEFWNGNPSVSEIQDALYGTKTDKTVYTLPWTYNGECTEKKMKVIYKNPGDILPENLDNNTIYVLNSGDYIIDWKNGIDMNTCSAIVGKGDVYIYSKTQIKDYGMINNNKGYQYTILDNLRIDGVFDGIKGTHETNSYGINILGGELQTDSSINRVRLYDNTQGLNVYKFRNASILNSQIYNNSLGAKSDYSENVKFFNIKIFNNKDGLSVSDSTEVSINNSQFYNQGNNGISLTDMKGPISIVNTYLYNNGVGLYASKLQRLGLFDSKIYNNEVGANFKDSSSNKYYGELQLFANDTNVLGTTMSDTTFTGGLISDTEVSNITTTNGYINFFGCMSCARYTNIENSLSVYMMDMSVYDNCQERGQISRDSKRDAGYEYGYRIASQKTGNIVSGNKVEESIIDFDSTEYIAQDEKIGDYTGDIACNFHNCEFDGNVVLHGSGVTAYLETGVSYTGTCESEYRVCDDGVLSGSYEYTGCEVAAPLDCTFNGETVLHGSGVTAYLETGVSYTGTCESEYRVCDDGVLSGSYEYTGCEVAEPLDCDFNGITVSHLSGIGAFFTTGVAYGSSCLAESEIRVCYNGVLNGTAPYTGCEVAEPLDCDFSGTIIPHNSGVALYFNTGVAYGSSCVAETRICNNGILNGSAIYTGCEAEGPANCYLNDNLILHGNSITVYENSSVACGQSCISESRICDNGILNGTYTNNACSVASCGGGSHTLHRDTCPNGDDSTSYYDGRCDQDISETVVNNILNNIENSKTDTLSTPTTINWHNSAKEDEKLTRYEAAKIIVNNAETLGLKFVPNKKCSEFLDVSDEQEYYVKMACFAGAMGRLENRIDIAESFHPNAPVLRAQSIVLLTSILFGDKYGIKDFSNVDKTNPFYRADPSAQALYEIGIVKYISNNRLKRIELREYFQIMIDRILILLGTENNILISEEETHGSASTQIYDETISDTQKALNDLFIELKGLKSGGGLNSNQDTDIGNNSIEDLLNNNPLS